MKILLVGGSTGGPVMPLVAVKQKIEEKHPDASFLLVGTSSGLEEQIAEKYHLPFVSIPAGKWRRYFSLSNLLVPFQVTRGFFKGLSLIRTFNPDVVFAAGGYVAVPMLMAAWILRKKIVIHQQDVFPTLTNQIVAPLADKVTVTFEHSMKDFRISSGIFMPDRRKHKVVWTGNPVREELLEKDRNLNEVKKSFGIKDESPIILFLGGATGALALNQILLEALPELTKNFHIIHSTGAGKGIEYSSPNYHPYEMILNLDDAYAIADLVISRAGLSTITELAALKKVSIIIPIPDSHQVYNAEILHQNKAAIFLHQPELSADYLISTIMKIMYDGVWQKQLSENIHRIMPIDAAARIADIIIELCPEKK